METLKTSIIPFTLLAILVGILIWFIIQQTRKPAVATTPGSRATRNFQRKNPIVTIVVGVLALLLIGSFLVWLGICVYGWVIDFFLWIKKRRFSWFHEHWKDILILLGILTVVIVAIFLFKKFFRKRSTTTSTPTTTTGKSFWSTKLGWALAFLLCGLILVYTVPQFKGWWVKNVTSTKVVSMGDNTLMKNVDYTVKQPPAMKFYYAPKHNESIMLTFKNSRNNEWAITTVRNGSTVSSWITKGTPVTYRPGEKIIVRANKDVVITISDHEF